MISERGFGGQPVVIDAEGRIDLGGRKPVLDLNHPSDGLMSALWGLSRGERTSGPASEGEVALHKMLSQLETAVVVSDDDPGSAVDAGDVRGACGVGSQWRGARKMHSDCSPCRKA